MVATLLPATGMFQLGMMYGGSVTVVYGFLTCFVFGIAMALSLARQRGSHRPAQHMPRETGRSQK